LSTGEFSLCTDVIAVRYVDCVFPEAHTWRTIVGILDSLLADGEFKAFRRLYLVSDNGSGFHQSETFHFYSFIQQLYGIEVSIHMLCPRHAYSLCDAHGGHTKTIGAEDRSATGALDSTTAFAAKLRQAHTKGRLKKTTVYEFDDPGDCDIVRFIEENHRKPKEIKITHYHTFHTSYVKNGKRTWEEGVMTAATTSDEPVSALLDFRPRKQGERCRPCEAQCHYPVLAADHHCPLKDKRSFNPPPPPPHTHTHHHTSHAQARKFLIVLRCDDEESQDVSSEPSDEDACERKKHELAEGDGDMEDEEGEEGDVEDSDDVPLARQMQNKPQKQGVKRKPPTHPDLATQEKATKKRKVSAATRDSARSLSTAARAQSPCPLI
jgi:hypothetical protein